MKSTTGCGLLLLALLGAWPRPAAATPSLDACTGMIEPTEDWEVLGLTVDSPGTWCLDQDLVSDEDNSQFGMISIAANDVTIDCRGHRLVYTGTADSSLAIGTDSFGTIDPRRRTTIRNCRIEGFSSAIVVGGDEPMDGFLIEDNVIVAASPTQFSQRAIQAWGSGTIRRNRIRDAIGDGIFAMGEVDIVDNLIDGLSDGPAGAAAGIQLAFPQGAVVSGNVIRGLRHDPAYPDNGPSRAILVTADDATNMHLSIRDNILVGDGTTPASGITCAIYPARVVDNVITGFAIGIDDCADVGDNDISP